MPSSGIVWIWKSLVVCVISGHSSFATEWNGHARTKPQQAGGFFSFIVSPKPDLAGFCSICVEYQSRESRTVEPGWNSELGYPYSRKFHDFVLYNSLYSV